MCGKQYNQLLASDDIKHQYMKKFDMDVISVMFLLHSMIQVALDDTKCQYLRQYKASKHQGVR